jgi:hypothetical protein
VPCPGFAPIVPLRSLTPASVRKVTPQSAAEKMPLYHLPRAVGGTRGPPMNAGERTPPSHYNPTQQRRQS